MLAGDPSVTELERGSEMLAMGSVTSEIGGESASFCKGTTRASQERTCQEQWVLRDTWQFARHATLLPKVWCLCSALLEHPLGGGEEGMLVWEPGPGRKALTSQGEG